MHLHFPICSCIYIRALSSCAYISLYISHFAVYIFECVLAEQWDTTLAYLKALLIGGHYTCMPHPHGFLSTLAKLRQHFIVEIKILVLYVLCSGILLSSRLICHIIIFLTDFLRFAVSLSFLHLSFLSAYSRYLNLIFSISASFIFLSYFSLFLCLSPIMPLVLLCVSTKYVR